jgi:hypothetical protein
LFWAIVIPVLSEIVLHVSVVRSSVSPLCVVLAVATVRKLPLPLSLQLLTVWVAPNADTAGRQNSAPMHAARGVNACGVSFMRWVMGYSCCWQTLRAPVLPVQTQNEDENGRRGSYPINAVLEEL